MSECRVVAWRVRLLSRGCDAVRGSGRFLSNAHAAVVALEGYGFAAPDGVHPSSSLGRCPGLGFRRTTFVDSDETGLEETQRDDIQDVDAFLFIRLGMIFERVATSVTFGRLPHVLHLVVQLFWGAPVVQAIIASYI